MSVAASPAAEQGWWSELARRLRREYGEPRLRNRRDPLDELVFVILSAQTEEYNYLRTYRRLRARFRSWGRVLESDEDAIHDTIQIGGLARKKARQIRLLLSRLQADHSRLDLEFLRLLDDAAAEDALVALPGVGRKTAKCVLLYSLDRQVFPVDAHVWRVLGRLGAIAGDDSRRKPSDLDQAALERPVPAELRYGLHVGLVLHGRRVCRSAAPRCGECVLQDLCSWAPTRRTPTQVTTTSAATANVSGPKARPSAAASPRVRSQPGLSSSVP